MELHTALPVTSSISFQLRHGQGTPSAAVHKSRCTKAVPHIAFLSLPPSSQILHALCISQHIRLPMPSFTTLALLILFVTYSAIGNPLEVVVSFSLPPAAWNVA